MIDHLKGQKILIIDDEPANVMVMEKMLGRIGFSDLVGSTDPLQALALFEEHDPSILILDLMMPTFDGFDVMKQIRPRVPKGSYFPILVVTADVTDETKNRALVGGATDFLTKPVDYMEVVLRVTNLLETFVAYRDLAEQNRSLDHTVAERTQELERRVNELSALNGLFQQNISDRFEVTNSYRSLVNSLAVLDKDNLALLSKWNQHSGEIERREVEAQMGQLSEIVAQASTEEVSELGDTLKDLLSSGEGTLG